jgi:hypothetical protein
VLCSAGMAMLMLAGNYAVVEWRICALRCWLAYMRWSSGSSTYICVGRRMGHASVCVLHYRPDLLIKAKTADASRFQLLACLCNRCA